MSITVDFDGILHGLLNGLPLGIDVQFGPDFTLLISDSVLDDFFLARFEVEEELDMLVVNFLNPAGYIMQVDISARLVRVPILWWPGPGPEDNFGIESPFDFGLDIDRFAGFDFYLVLERFVVIDLVIIFGISIAPATLVLARDYVVD
ncbi:MAG: hypothetical protein GY771_08065, partial [bacterium]|nr:hypothetical protein [bacterium]